MKLNTRQSHPAEDGEIVLCHGYDDPFYNPQNRRSQTLKGSGPRLGTNAGGGTWKLAGSLSPDEAFMLACLPMSVSYSSDQNAPLFDPPNHSEALLILGAWRNGAVHSLCSGRKGERLKGKAGVTQEAADDEDATPIFADGVRYDESTEAFAEDPFESVEGEEEELQRRAASTGKASRPKWLIGKPARKQLDDAYSAFLCEPSSVAAGDDLWDAIYEFGHGQARVQSRLLSLRLADTEEDTATDFVTHLLEKLSEGKFQGKSSFASWVSVCFRNFTSTALKKTNRENERMFHLDMTCEVVADDEWVRQGRTFTTEDTVQQLRRDERAQTNVSKCLDSFEQLLTQTEVAVFRLLRVGKNTEEISLLLKRSRQGVRSTIRQIEGRYTTQDERPCAILQHSKLSSPAPNVCG
jgi:DNA-directed RNA polymerase specialized sigma24 family protein